MPIYGGFDRKKIENLLYHFRPDILRLQTLRVTSPFETNLFKGIARMSSRVWLHKTPCARKVQFSQDAKHTEAEGHKGCHGILALRDGVSIDVAGTDPGTCCEHF